MMNNNSLEVKRLLIVVSGRVQGVGFRYFTRESANRCTVSGWVRNEYDGSVKAEAQGSPTCLKKFTNMVKNGPRYGNVSNFQSHEIPIVDNDSGFFII